MKKLSTKILIVIDWCIFQLQDYFRMVVRLYKLKLITLRFNMKKREALARSKNEAIAGVGRMYYIVKDHLGNPQIQTRAQIKINRAKGIFKKGTTVHSLIENGCVTVQWKEKSK